MEIRELVAIVRANIDDFRTNMRAVGTITNDFQKNWRNASVEVYNSFEKMTAAATLFFGGVAAWTAKVGVGFKSMTENAEVMLTTLTGSVDQAKASLAELLKFSKETPFEFAGVQAAAIQLLNAKVTATELIPIMRKVGDAVASVGGGDEALRGVSVALAQMMTAGRVNAQDMMQLTNRGIAGWDMLAKRLGKSVAEVRELSEKGALDGRESAMLIIDEMGKRGAGAAAAMSQRFTGLWSSLKDDFSQFCGHVWEPLYDAMVSVMGRISKGFNSGGLEPIMNRLRNAIQQVCDVILQLIATHGDAFIKSLVDAFVWLAQATVALTLEMQSLMPWLLQTAASVWSFIAPLLQYLADHPQILAALIALKVTGVMGLNTAFLSLIPAIVSTIGLLGQIPAVITAITPLLAALFATPAGMAFVAVLTALAAGYALYKLNCDDATEAKIRFDKAHEQAKDQKQTDEDNFFKGRSLDDMVNRDKEIADLREREQAARASGDTNTADKLKFQADQKNQTQQNVIEELRAAKDLVFKQINDLKASARAKFDAGDKEGGSADLNKSQQLLRDNMGFAKKVDQTLRDYSTKRERDREARQRAEAQEQQQAKQPSVAERKLEEKIRDLENKSDQKALALPGLDKFRDMLLTEGMNPQFASRIAGAQKGATQADVAAFNDAYSKINPKDKAAVDELTEWFMLRLKVRLDGDKADGKVEEKITKGTTDTAHTVWGLQDKGLLDASQVKKFSEQVIALNNAFRNGAITEQQYRLALNDVEAAARALAGETKKGAKDAAKADAKDLKNANLGDTALFNMQKKVNAQFGTNFASMNPYMQMVSMRVAELKKQFQSGDLTLEEYKMALFLLEKEVDAATKAVTKQAQAENKLAMKQGAGMGGMGMGNGMDPMLYQYQMMLMQMQGFGDAAANGMYAINGLAGSAFQVGESFNTLGPTIQLAADDFVGSMNELVNPQQSILTPTDPSFMRDPGLQSNGSRSVSISLPNVNRLTQADSRLIADTVAQELGRRGSSVYR